MEFMESLWASCRKIADKYPKTSKSIAILLTLTSARQLYHFLNRKYNKYPPGDYGIPFFGSLFSCADITNYASYLASNYGPISMIYIGFQKFIFLHSINTINEVFKNKNSYNREFEGSLLMKHLKPYELPTASINETYWPRKRKMFQSILVSKLNSTFINNVHNYSFQNDVFKSIQICIDENKLWYPAVDTNYVQFHVIWYSLFGKFVSFNDKSRVINIQYLSTTFAEAGKDVVLKYLGILNLFKNIDLCPSFRLYGEYLEQTIYKELGYDESVFDMRNNEWKKHFDDVMKDNNACLVSKLIASHRKNPGIDSTKNSIISEVLQLTTAAIHSTMLTSEYGVLLLAKNPDIQELIYTELIEIYDNDIFMNKTDFRSVIHKFHYLRAFTYEVLRISSVLPTGVPRMNSKEDIKVNGYIIPKGSVIIADIPSANRNDSYWTNKMKNTMEVNISSWLDNNNHFKYNLNKDKIVTFGIGERNCAGESFALRTLYLLFSKLVMSFKYYLDKDHIIKQKYEFALIIKPKIGIKVSNRE